MWFSVTTVLLSHETAHTIMTDLLFQSNATCRQDRNTPHVLEVFFHSGKIFLSLNFGDLRGPRSSLINVSMFYASI